MMDGDKDILREVWKTPGAMEFLLDTQQYMKSHFQPTKDELRDISQYFDDDFPSLVVPAREELWRLLDKCPVLRSGQTRKILDKIKFVAEMYIEENHELPNMRELGKTHGQREMDKSSSRFKRAGMQPMFMLRDMARVSKNPVVPVSGPAKAQRSGGSSRQPSRQPSRTPSRTPSRQPSRQSSRAPSPSGELGPPVQFGPNGTIMGVAPDGRIMAVEPYGAQPEEEEEEIE
jgi:hypothetical protein